jgi:hypothetical protein
MLQAVTTSIGTATSSTSGDDGIDPNIDHSSARLSIGGFVRSFIRSLQEPVIATLLWIRLCWRDLLVLALCE